MTLPTPPTPIMNESDCVLVEHLVHYYVFSAFISLYRSVHLFLNSCPSSCLRILSLCCLFNKTCYFLSTCVSWSLHYVVCMSKPFRPGLINPLERYEFEKQIYFKRLMGFGSRPGEAALSARARFSLIWPFAKHIATAQWVPISKPVDVTISPIK